MMIPFPEFMDRYDLGFRGRIRGGGDREIAALEEIYQRPLPESYASFLRVMGADPGGFVLINKAKSDYPSVLEKVRDLARDEQLTPVLRRFVLVANNFFEDAEHRHPLLHLLSEAGTCGRWGSAGGYPAPAPREKVRLHPRTGVCPSVDEKNCVS